MKKSRRSFLKNLAQDSAVVAISGANLQFSSKSYKRIIGANERIRVSVIGVSGRGTGRHQL